VRDPVVERRADDRNIGLAVREDLGVPVRFVGVGEGLDDLRPFDARAFAERLVGGDSR
jgi:fused signal recognition particle receptor